MGADIHCVLEKRVAEGQWVAVNTFQSHHRTIRKPDDVLNGFSSPVARSRNYRRFAALAGVRGDGPEPRGLPADASETTRHLVSEWGEDGHSHSWLPITDAARIYADTEYWLKDEGPECWARMFPMSFFFGVESEHDLDSHRLVFWFDN